MKALIFAIVVSILFISCSSNNKPRVQQLKEYRERLTLQLASETDTNQIKAINKKIAMINIQINVEVSTEEIMNEMEDRGIYGDTVFALDKNGKRIIDPLTEKALIISIVNSNSDTVMIDNNIDNVIIKQDDSEGIIVIDNSAKVENVSISQKGKNNNNKVVIGSNSKVKNLVIKQE